MNRARSGSQTCFTVPFCIFPWGLERLDDCGCSVLAFSERGHRVLPTAIPQLWELGKQGDQRQRKASSQSWGSLVCRPLDMSLSRNICLHSLIYLKAKSVLGEVRSKEAVEMWSLKHNEQKHIGELSVLLGHVPTRGIHRGLQNGFSCQSLKFKQTNRQTNKKH